MIILRSEQELEKFIQEESEMCGKHNSWLEGEIRDSIKPKEYPCAVFTHWGEGASGCYLVSSVVYQSDFEPVMEMCLCEPEHLFLKPDKLYRFVVSPSCDRCKELAEKVKTP